MISPRQASRQEAIPEPDWSEVCSDIYYDPRSGTNGVYYCPNGIQMVRYGTRHTKTFIAKRIGNEYPPFLEEALYWVEENNHVAQVVSLAGYQTGLWPSVNGKRVLVPEQLSPMVPNPRGECPDIERIMDGLFGPQRGYVEDWIKVAYEQLRDCLATKPGNKIAIRVAQILILVGPQHAGKNLFQEAIVTPILGGSSANPHSMISGGRFTSKLVGCAHWLVSDKPAPKDRAAFKTIMTSIASDPLFTMEKKGADEFDFPVYRRVTISCNEDEESLKIIPPLAGLEDKVTLVHCLYSDQFIEDYAARRDAIEAQLPAYLYKVLARKIHPERRHQRYVIKGFQDPELRKMVDRIEKPERALLLLKAVYGPSKLKTKQVGFDEQSAHDLFEEIGDTANKFELLEIAKSSAAFGRLLGELIRRPDPPLTRSIYVGEYFYSTTEAFKEHAE